GANEPLPADRGDPSEPSRHREERRGGGASCQAHPAPRRDRGTPRRDYQTARRAGCEARRAPRPVQGDHPRRQADGPAAAELMTRDLEPGVERSFFAHDARVVARALVGAYLVHDMPSGQRVARIVETEAYRGPTDLACHARAGLTRRTRTLFGPPGHA